MKMKRSLLSSVNRRLLRVSAPVLMLAPWMMIERAEAACSPSSPVNNTAVSCTGTQTNANGATGNGTSADSGNTYSLNSGATLTGTDIGLLFKNGTVDNS